MVFKILLTVCLILNTLNEARASGKSLFDDLPLNGAYATNGGGQGEDDDSNSQLSPVLSPRPTVGRMSENSSIESNSLFDTLPNQGAIVTTDTVFESKTQKRGILLGSPPGELRFQIELERQTPLAEYTLHQFQGNSNSPGLQTLVPILPLVQGNNLPPISQQYGTPVIPTPVRSFPENFQNQEQTVIAFGSQVPNFRNPTALVQNNLNPPRQDARNHYYAQENPRNSGYEQKLPFPILGPSTPPSARGYGPETGNQNIDITTPAPPPTFRPITTSAPPPPPPPSIRPPSRPTGDYDYDTLEDTRKKERFGARRGLFRYTEPSESYNAPSEEAKSYYNDNRQPTDSYGPPNPPPSYGPPTSPPPSYGPPPQRAPEYVPPPPRPSASSTTSISYQTIPIQTVQTQLVTVPQITVSSSSTGEVDSNGNSRPQGQPRPQQSYGIVESPSRGGIASGSIFTDEQIALLLSASGGTRGENLYENDDALSLLLGGIGREAGNSPFTNPDLDAAIQLGNSRTRFGSIQRPVLLNSSPLQFSSNRFRNGGGHTALFENQFQSQLLAQQLQQQRFRNSELPLLGGTRNGPVLTGDAVNAVDDILREQRLRGAIAELRGRLRHEGQSSIRARQNYRSLLYKGALLLGALTLLPAVATPLAAAASGIQTPHFLLPLAASRGRRSIKSEAELDGSFTALFEICRSKMNSNEFQNGFPLLAYLNCIENKTAKTSADSLFDSMLFSGALAPETIRSSLQKYIPIYEILKNSNCIQKEACETILKMQKSHQAESLKLLQAAFADDFRTNQWLRSLGNGVQNSNCSNFQCD